MTEHRLNRILVNWLAPASIFLVLTGMLWLDERGAYPKLFYLGIICAFWLPLAAREWPREFLAQPIVGALLLFVLYFSVSLLWRGDADETALITLKRPWVVFLLFLLVFELGRQKFSALQATVSLAAVVAVLAAITEIGNFVLDGGAGRLVSSGALRNPLLISHVYGFFAALWLAALVSADSRKLFVPALLATLVLLALLILTGSRTPLVAFFVTVAWLAVVQNSRAARLFMLFSVAAGALIYLAFPELLTSRGLSYRPEIWRNALGQIGEHLWLGHGLGAPLFIEIPDIGYPFRDPHNMTLSVMYQGGVVALIIWVSLYATSLFLSRRYRSNREVVIASAAVVYGLFAGMTEGGAILPRPKEHWFLVWIPLALLTAALYRARSQDNV